jgi:hypothetical protein
MNFEKKTVYLETTIPSYATAKTSSDVIIAGKQSLTKIFWEQERCKYDLFTSQYTYEECSLGDIAAAKRRLNFLVDIPVLPKSDESDCLALTYQRVLNIPNKAKMDCFHLAVCVTARLDFLLSWNCNHLGIISYTKIKAYNDIHGLWTPVLTTPEALIQITEENL